MLQNLCLTSSQRRVPLLALVLLVDGLSPQATLAAEASSGEQRYRSPYRVEFTIPHDDLIGDLEHTERGDLRLQAEIPHHEWYSHATRERAGSWGPHPRLYPPPIGADGLSTGWKRERVISVGLRFVGYGYQHHHVPDWDPPADWPWKHTAIGHNGRGVDCSNFTGFVYNLGFGIHLSTEVHKQAEAQHAETTAHGRQLRLHRIELPESYDQRTAALRTGDLLYILNGKREHVSHVVLWVGPIGKSPDGAPLVLDSHGDDVKDCHRETIPAGIHLRPFREHSWYNRSASHALRLFADE